MDKKEGGNKDSRDRFKPHHDSPDQDRSLPERILESATSLVQSGFAGSKDDASSLLSKALADGEKLPPSSSSSSTYSRDTESSAGLIHPRGSGASNTNTSIGESFRSVRSNSSDNFLALDEDNSRMPVQESRLDSLDLSGTSWDKTDPKGKRILRGQAQKPLEKLQHQGMMEAAWAHHHSSAQSPKYPDGAKVSQLLSDPMFDPLFGVDDDSLHDGQITLSNEDMEVAQLFHDRSSIGDHRQNIALVNSGSDTSFARSDPDTALSHKLESALSLPVDHQRLHEIDTFFDDLMNYHDSVWGYAQPLVEDARKEVKSTVPGQVPDGPALQRLRMIFAHMNN
ncbi:MAG: hypothetical protein Q9160_004505 [Pyrenula sp. 1 TL-2023]